MAVLLAASGAAFAASGGGSSSEGTTGSGATANGVYPAPTQGVEQGADATGAPGSTTGTMHKKHHHHSHMKKHSVQKPMNDTTNTPGADASSDTKGN